MKLIFKGHDARYAVVEPARRAGVAWTPEAAIAVVEASNGYPAHLQLFAHTIWTTAPGPDQITAADVEAALPQIADLLERRTRLSLIPEVGAAAADAAQAALADQ